MDWRILYNPLAVLGKDKGLVAAIIIVIVLTAVAWWAGVHLDGVLDLHITPERPSAVLITVESLIDWLSLGILLFLASKVFGGNGGAGAHLAAAGLSRFPYILASVLMSRQLLGGAMLQEAITIGEQEVAVRPQDLLSPALIIGSLILLVLIIWSVVLLYLGYKDSSRIEGGKVVAAFVIGLVLAEVISKVLIYLAFRAGI